MSAEVACETTIPKLVPYHWNDRELYYRDSVACYESFERLLPAIADSLNKLLGVNYSQRYWRITVGPWLLLLVEVVCDRLKSLEKHLANAPSRRMELSSLVAQSSDFWQSHSETAETISAQLIVPNSTNHFRELISTDEFNAALYLNLFRKYFQVIPEDRPKIEAETECNSAPACQAGARLPSGSGTLAAKTRSLANLVLTVYTRILPRKLNRCAFITSYFRPIDLVKLQLAMGQAPYPRAPEVYLAPSSVQATLRSSLSARLGTCCATAPAFSQLEQSCLFLAPSLLPLTFLEDYARADTLSRRNLPHRPKVIVAGNAHISDDLAQLWIASNVELGTKFIVVQHGGHYGTGRWSSTDEFEIDIADRFLSWGWTRGGTDSERIQPIDAPKLIGINRRIRPQTEGNILLALNSVPRYSYRTYSVPIASQYLYYLDSIARFCSALPLDLRSQLLIRCHPKSWGWNDQEILTKRIPEATIYRGPNKLESQLNRAKLFVATHNATTFLETLAANFPTVIFWENWYYELNETAQPFFDKLKEARIFFNDPNEAAQHLRTISGDVGSWWQSPSVQSARKEFIAQYAYASPSWKTHWLRLLRPICDQAENNQTTG